MGRGGHAETLAIVPLSPCPSPARGEGSQALASRNRVPGCQSVAPMAPHGSLPNPSPAKGAGAALHGVRSAVGLPRWGACGLAAWGLGSAVGWGVGERVLQTGSRLQSGGLQKKFDLHGIERELNLPRRGSTQDTGSEQCRDIAVNGLDIAVDPACRLAYRHRTRSAHGSEKLPPLGGQNSPQQFWRREGNARLAVGSAHLDRSSDVTERLSQSQKPTLMNGIASTGRRACRTAMRPGS